MKLLRKRFGFNGWTRIVFLFVFVFSSVIGLSPSIRVSAEAAKKPLSAGSASPMVITGVIDGPLTGGIPKAIEVYVGIDIVDLSIYGLGSANNGGGTDGEEFTFPAVSATAGDFLYIASESTAFTSWFGFAPDYTSSAASINGDDAIELFENGSVIDVFGDINVDGTGQPWEYMDGWAYRVDETGPDGSAFILANWTFSGPDALDDETTNATATTPFPTGSYMPPIITLILTGVIDGPLTGGIPKAIEVYVGTDIVDLSIYGLGSANNGGGTDGEEFTFPAVSATAGDFLYIASESTAFTSWFGFAPDYTSSAASINGDDAIELFENGSVIDVFGDINVDGSGQPWEYMDGWAYRVDETGPDGSVFVLANWTFSGPDALDDETTNATATTPFPTGSYSLGGSGSDIPPTVSSTTPANLATDVAIDADITVNFSEGVTVTGSWFTINCASSGAHTAAVSGGPQNYTLNPDADFSNSEVCTVTVVAAQVADQDGTADNMAADYVFSFTIINSSTPTIIINEVDADQVGTDAAEFVELYDGGAGNTALDGLVVVFFNGSDDQSYTPALDLDGYSTNGDGYFVICGDAANVPNCDLDTSPNTNLIQNGADAVALYTGDAADFPNDTSVTTTDLLDAIVYDTDDSDDAGLLVLLNAGQPQVNERGGGDGTAHSNQRCPDGTGGARNTDSYSQFPPTPGSANNCSSVATHIVINEVDADQAGTDAAEFVELYDGGAGNTALDGLVVVFFNGSDDQSYTPALDLDGYSTNGDGYFVICGDAANVSNCDLDTSPNTNLIQNGADAVALYTGDAADFPNDTPVTTTALLDAIVYDTDDSDDAGLLVLLNAGQPQVNERGGGDGTAHSNQRCPDGTGGARNTVTYSQFPPTPGSANTCAAPTGCGTPATLISAVQGPGTVSPLIGSTVTIEAIVTADFQESDELSGFFLQEEVSDDDLNPLTSEGIFIYHSSTDVAVGDLVHLTGTAGEYYNMTQISYVTDLEICSNSNPLPTVTPLLLPLNTTAALEIVEGMYVQYSLPLYVTETYNLGRYGEVWLSSISPLYNPTNVVEPGTDANLMEIANDLNRVLLDDFSQIQNPPTVPYLRPSNDTLRIGDTVANLTGVINYSYSYYRLQPTTPVTFTPTNGRPNVPSVGGTLNVASFNVLNYFTTLDSRGADTAGEFTRQRDKIIEAIIALDADVIGLMEIENNGYGTSSAIYDLVSGLNDIAGAGTYDFIDPGVAAIGSDEIAVGLLYKVNSVEPVGLASILDSSVDPNFNSEKNRPALAQTFRDLSNDGQFTVVVNHLKSKGSDCNDIGDPDTGDGQGNCNLTRTSAAAAMVDWLATDPTGTSETDFLIIGDLNAYLQEDPIDAIEVGADDTEGTTDDYVDLVTQFAGNSIPYSYVYDGERGVLDHALASSTMQSQVTGVAHWHINADEPRILDYNTEYGQEALNLYVVDPFRSSDHDPVVIGLNLTPQTYVDLPLLMTKFFDVLQGELVSFDPLYDLNPNGLAWVEESIRIVSGPHHGSAWVASVHYRSHSSYVGDDTLTYQVCDTSNQCWRVVVNYTVKAKALPDTGFTPGVRTEFAGVSNLQPLSANGISLSIPSLDVDVEIVGVPLSGDSWDVRWLSGQAGYLAGTAYPTWNGNTLLTAHIYDANGLPGPFHQLKSLKWGDVVQIDAYGLTYTYQVRQVYHWVSPSDARAFQHEEMDWITLVTCQGYDSASDSYPWRTIVRAVLVSVE